MSTAGELVPQSGSTLKAVVPLRYRVWPLRQRAAWRAAPPWMVVAIAAVTGILTGSFVLTMLASSVMVAATWRFFLPADYTIDSQGIQIESLGRKRLIRWSIMRRIEPLEDRMEVYLATGSKAADRSSTCEVPFGGHRDEVLGWAERFAALALQKNGTS